MAGPSLKNITALLNRAAKSRVGLDIGTSSVKVLMLSSLKGGGYELSAFASERILGEKKKADIVDAIKKALKSANIKTKEVITSVGGQSVVVRQIVLPKMTTEEVKSAIKYEAEKYIPFSINEVYLDAQIIDDKGADNNVKVILVAAKKDLVDEHISYLKEAGLKPGIIDTDSIAIVNSFLFNNPGEGKDKTLVLINIGARLTNICMLKDESLIFVRDIPIGGQDLTDAIKSAMNLDDEAAERMKWEPDERVEEIDSAIKSALENLENQIRLSFDYYENQFGKGIDRIYLSGGASQQMGLDRHLVQALGIKVSFWDTIKALKISPKVSQDSLKKSSSQFAVCVGLALRK